MKIYIDSDFTDYYDHAFDKASADQLNDNADTLHVIRRNTTDFIPRTNWFLDMSEKGVSVIPYGEAKFIKEHLTKDIKGFERNKSVINKILDQTELVVYLDEYKHQGEGKEVMTLRKAANRFPNHLASLYFKTRPVGSRSIRYLKIADRYFFIEYISYSDWRSNYGDGEINLLDDRGVLTKEELTSAPFQHIPMYAIDFVEYNDVMFAVDFNLSPKISGTGVDKILSPTEIYNSMKEFYHAFSQ